MTDADVEAVARGIAAKHEASWDGTTVPWDELSEAWREMYFTLARAAIAADPGRRELEEALERAGNQFRSYERQHRAQAADQQRYSTSGAGYDEKLRKAEINKRFADMCDTALSLSGEK